MNEKDCLEIGGHCWNKRIKTYFSNPARYVKVCKHCETENKTIKPEGVL